MARLNERVLARIEQVRDVRRRGRVFGFPQQVATMREPLVQYVNDVFAGSRFDRQVLLRGVYFTSGTQDGTPIDRLLGSIGRRFGAAEAVMAPAGPGRSYFTADLLQQVIVAESGLAGVNRRLEARKAATQLGAYAAMGLLAAIGATLASVSYARNRQFLAQTATQVAAVEATPRVNSASPLDSIVARLDAIRRIVDSAEQYRLDTGWPLRWGLYQGRVIGNAARDAYSQQLDSVVLPRLGTLLAARMQQDRSQPDRAQTYMKAYLMLGTPAQLDKPYLRKMAEAEWKAAATAQTGARLTFHFNHLLDESGGLRPLALDDRLVNQARNTLSREQLVKVLYENIKQSHNVATTGALRLEEALGFDAQKVFKRRSGTPLSEALPPFFTRDVFKQVVEEGQSGLVKQIEADGWIWGDSAAASLAAAKGVLMQVLDLYEQDYIRHWDNLLKDLEFVPHGTVAETSEALRILTSESTPLRNLLRVVAVNTMLVEPPPAAAAPPPKPGMLGQATQRIQAGIGSLMKQTEAGAGAVTGEPGRLVTARFEWVRAVTAGDPGKTQLDAVLRILGETQQQLAAVGDGVTGVDVAQIQLSRVFQAQLQALRQEANDFPPELSALLLQIARAPERVVKGGATAQIGKAYADQVVRPCLLYIDGKYPFAPAHTEVKMADFGDVFGHGGIFDTFFTKVLAEQVDTSGEPWAWRPDAVRSPGGMLEQFRAAQQIRGMFFKSGSKVPEIDFTVTVTGIDPGTTRFVLEIDGARTDQKPGPPTSRDMTWPRPAGGATAVTFAATSYQPPMTYPTAWGWLRLMDATTVEPADEQQRVRLRIKNPPHHADVVVEPKRAYASPFADQTWRQFRCTS